MKSILIFFIVFMVSCSPEPENNTAPKVAESEYVKVEYHNDYQIGSYTSSPWGFDTNSYWIEGPHGVVLIGTQFLPSAANEAVNIAESVTGKKVVMAIVLHANPDKFNGTATLKSRGIKVVSSNQIVSLIPDIDEQRREWFYDRYKPDYPEKLVLPDALWDKTQEFEAAGLRFKAYVIRDAVSDAHLLIGLDDHLFVGDLIVNKYHAWMESGKSKQWLERLEEIRKFVKPAVIHPGRGYAMNGDELLNQQEAYLRFVNKTINRFYTGGEITEQDKKDIIKVITEKYPDYGFEYFLNIGIPAEWQQTRQKDHEMMMSK
ncbi:MAG: hydrolase [Gammaproteobacteria bacterium]|nr:hydrolase [Gammaproteobacteria bacterium]